MQIIRRLREQSLRTLLLEAVVIFALIAIAEVVTRLAQRPTAPTPTPTVPAAVAQVPTGTAVWTPGPTVGRSPTVPPTLTPTATQVTVQVTTVSPSETPLPTAVAREDGKVYLGERVLLDVAEAAPECQRVGEISYSPTGEHFLVILACQGWQDVAFLFRADGSDRRAITGAWDYIRYLNHRWAPDGRSFIYERINACCVPRSAVPRDAPLPGLVQYDIQTGQKRHVSKYQVVNVQSRDVLNVRAGPGVGYPVVGQIPWDGNDVEITGEQQWVGSSPWVPVGYGEAVGWVNMDFLEPQNLP